MNFTVFTVFAATCVVMAYYIGRWRESKDGVRDSLPQTLPAVISSQTTLEMKAEPIRVVAEPIHESDGPLGITIVIRL